MWGLLSQRVQTFVLVLFGGAIVWSLTSLISYFSAVNWAVSILLLILIPVTNLVWRWIWKRVPYLEKFFPDLNGIWWGSLQSNYRKPGATVPIDPIPIAIRIRQSFFRTSVVLQSAESGSQSVREVLEVDRNNGTYGIWYLYMNNPDLPLQERSRKHDGCAKLQMNLDVDRNHLTGQYFTERNTNGTMDLKRVSEDPSADLNALGISLDVADHPMKAAI